MVTQVENIVDRMAETSLSQNLSSTGGAQLVASILNKSNNNAAKQLIKSIEEKESTRVRFTETLVPLSIEKIDKFRDLVGHWGLMCTLSDDEWEGMKKLYDEV